jgi:hypothetical protein
MNLNSVLAYNGDLYIQKLRSIVSAMISPGFLGIAELQEQYDSLFEGLPENFPALVELRKPTVRDTADVELINLNASTLYFYCVVVNYLIDELVRENDKLNAYEAARLNDLIKLKSRIKQKFASIALASGDVKFSFVESFNTNEFLLNSANSLKASEGYLTLPVDSVQAVTISTFSIGSQSKGALGSSDPNYPATSDLSEVLGGAHLQWEQLDSGAAILQLELNFAQEEIINQLALKFYPIEDTSSCIATSIRCYSKGSSVELLTDSTAIDSEDNVIPFYPVKTSKIFITLQQTSGYQVVIDGQNAIDRKVISLSEIKAQRAVYRAEGAIESKEISVYGTPNACQVLVDTVFTNDNLYTRELVYTVDDGSTWQPETVVGAFGGIISVFWKMILRRNEAAFLQNSSVHAQESDYEYAVQLESVSGLRSPSLFSLRKKAISDKITVIQPRIMRVGNPMKGLVIGKGGGSELKLRLGMELSPDLAESSTVRVNGVAFTYVATLATSTSADKHWTLDKSDYQYIIFGNGTNGAVVSDGAVVTMSLDYESVQFEEVADGYVTKFDHVFDPDPDSISLTYVAESFLAGKVILEKNKKIHKLPYKNIVADSIRFSEKNQDGTAATPGFVTAKTSYDLVLADGDYYVDLKNGYLYAWTATANSSVVTVSFNFYPMQTLKKDSFTVLYEDSKPAGVVVKKNSFPAKLVTDPLGVAVNWLSPMGIEVRSYFTALAGEYTFNFSRRHPVKMTVDASDLFADTDIVPPEEIALIDGHTEFLGLVRVISEKTSEFAANQVASFVVKNGSKYYAPLGIAFDSALFITEVGAVPTMASTEGDWYIDLTTGTVSIRLGAGAGDFLPSGVTYSYYYRDDTFDSTNKFSVDYTNGILYSATAFQSGGTISYKAANFYATYDVASLVEGSLFNRDNSTIEVRTEGSFDYSRLIKIIYPVKVNQISLDDLKNYYSPIVRSISFRFT